MQAIRTTSKMTAVLLAAAVTVSAAVSLKNGNDAPVVAADEAVKILAMGDSITDGYINGDNGYRKYFCYDLQQNGITNFDMVGAKNNWTNEATYNWNGTPITYDPAHSGYSGYAIQKIGSRQGLQETIFDTTYTNGDRSGNMLDAYEPDVIMLQIGTNDILDAQLTGIGDRLEELVDRILPYVSETGKVLYLASIPDIDVSVRYDWLGAYEWAIEGGVSYAEDPVTFTANVQKALDDYNTTVKNLVAKKQAEGANIQFSDINSVIDIAAGDLEDGVHPSEQGYAKMGQYWSTLLTETYFNGTVNPPVTTTTTTETTTTETTTETTTVTTVSTIETTTPPQTTTTTETQTTPSGSGSDVILTDVDFGIDIDISAYEEIASIDIVIQERPEYGMNGCVSFDGWNESTNFTLDDFDGTVLTVTPSKDYNTMTINKYYGDVTLQEVVIHLKGSAVTTDSTTETTVSTTETTTTATTEITEQTAETTTATEETTTTDATTMTTTTVTTELGLLAGDINADGVVDLKDLVLLQKYLLHKEPLMAEQASCVDLNGDNRLDVIDAILLRRLLLQEG